MSKFEHKDDPDTLVDRLNGIYTGGQLGITGQYKASPLEMEAAREIVRLREDMTAFLEKCGRLLLYYDNKKPSEEG